MKRLYTLLLPACLLLTSCQLSLDKISSGVKMVGKCCKSLSITNSNIREEIKTSSEEKDNPKESSSILPFNLWDTKMMAW